MRLQISTKQFFKWFVVGALTIGLSACNLPGVAKTTDSVSATPPTNMPTPTAFLPIPSVITPLSWNAVTAPIETRIVVETSPTSTEITLPTVPPTAVPTMTEYPSPTATLPPTTIPTAIPTVLPPSLPPTSEALPVYPMVERATYSLQTTVDYDNHSVAVAERIYYTNHTGQSLNYLLLGVNPNLWNGVFTLYSVRMNGSYQTYFELIGQNLNIYPTNAILPGETILVELEYRLDLPYSTGKLENFGYTARQVNLTDWYPFIPPFKNGEWVLPAPNAFGENLVYEKTDLSVDLSVVNAAWQPVVAASAVPVIDGNGYHYQVRNARNFTLSLSPEFQVLSDQVNGIQIEHYYFADSANAAAQVLEATKQAVRTYSEAFGPYPNASLTVVETDLNDGLEADGLYFLSRSFYQNYTSGYKNNLFVIAIHETAHQWWYGSVGNDQANEPWLDEALSTYSERVFFAMNYPEDLQWWWNFRVYSHSVSGYVDSRIYDHALYSQYVSAIYFNGVEFLDLLRQRVGNESFAAFLKIYYATYSGRTATGDNFFGLLSQSSVENYADIVDSYFLFR